MAGLEGLPYSPSFDAGDWVVISGQLGVRDGVLVEGFEAEVDQCLANLLTRLEDNGLGPQHVVKTTCMLTDLDRFAEFNERYAAVFTDPRPARTTFEVSRLPLGASVEVEAWAKKP